VGFQNSATVADLGFLRGPHIFIEEAAEHRSALDPHLGEVSDGVIGYGRVELAAAMRASAVVVRLVLG
jgi:lactate dehydrogenase-like 2-hydroxyacid dehydrogenase